MPDIRLRNQPFDLAFHPLQPVLFTGLLTGEIKAFRYDDSTGDVGSSSWTSRPSKKTARALSVEIDGEGLWMGGKAGGVYQLDTKTGAIKKEKEKAHESPVNRIHCINTNLIASGDDEGVIKFWDPRQADCLRTYSQHYDYISDFVYLEDKRQLISTSGDGHLSVIDIRSSKSTPLQVSDDQEDELLSLTPIKQSTKLLVGSGLGILSVWDRKKGFGDCVDRIPGHPASIDAVVALTEDVVATGSEDGMIRVMQILPNKFLGVIATHEEFPIERMKLDRNNKWLGSVSHDECLKLTDVEDLFEESDDEDEEGSMVEEGMEGVEESVVDDEASNAEGEAMDTEDDGNVGMGEDEEEEDSDEEEDKRLAAQAEKRREKKDRRGKGVGGMGDMGVGKNEGETNGFFDDL